MFQRFDAQIAHVSLSEHIAEVELAYAKDNLEVRSLMDERMRRLLLILDMHLQAGDRQQLDYTEVKYPADWVQAFKQRWFPGWLLQRYPVRMTAVRVCVKTIQRMCPHLSVPKDNIGTRSHVSWLMKKDD